MTADRRPNLGLSGAAFPTFRWPLCRLSDVPQDILQYDDTDL